MQLGMIGLGRMGANIARRVADAGHECVVYDHNPDAVKDYYGSHVTVSATVDKASQTVHIDSIAAAK